MSHREADHAVSPEAAERMHRGVAVNTTRTYTRAWQSFGRWCATGVLDKKKDPVPGWSVRTVLPATPETLLEYVSHLIGMRRRGIGFSSLHENLDTTTPGGRLVFHVFAALAEFIRELIVEGTKEGIEAARSRGQRLGRPPAMTSEQISHARDLLTNPKNTVSSIARLLGVSRSTIYKYVPELIASRPAMPGRRAGELEGYVS